MKILIYAIFYLTKMYNINISIHFNCLILEHTNLIKRLKMFIKYRQLKALYYYRDIN